MDNLQSTENALTHRASVNDPLMMSIAACTAETPQVGTRRTVAAVIPTACES